MTPAEICARKRRDWALTAILDGVRWRKGRPLTSGDVEACIRASAPVRPPMARYWLQESIGEAAIRVCAEREPHW